MHILLIEDDLSVVEVLLQGLTGEGHTVDACGTGEEGLEHFGINSYDAVILDVGLPGMGGFEVATRLRLGGDTTPLLMLTARETERDVIQGLALGADAYMTKPFSVGELIAHLRAIRRRVAVGFQKRLSFADLNLDQVTREVTFGGTPVRLTEAEFKLLAALVKRKGRVLSHEKILEEVWELDFDPGTTLLASHLSNLRKKLNAVGPPVIENVRGVGYRIIQPHD